MARNVNDLINSLPANRRRKIEKRAVALMAEEMTLQELRRARAMTQVRLAKNLGIAQKQVSEIEKRTDMPSRPFAAPSRRWGQTVPRRRVPRPQASRVVWHRVHRRLTQPSPLWFLQARRAAPDTRRSWKRAQNLLPVTTDVVISRHSVRIPSLSEFCWG